MALRARYFALARISARRFAVAACGPGWEARGRAQLAVRAAALLALLLPGPVATGGGAGTASATTTLAPKAAVLSHGGLSGWQLAAVFVVVFGVVAGAVVGVGRLAAGSASPGGAPASAKPLGAGPAGAACGSPGGPPLAYMTISGPATALSASVVVRCGTGTPDTLGTFGYNGISANALAWSSDGTQLAWVTGTTVDVARARAGTWTLRSWPCNCSGIAFQGGQAVSVSQRAAGNSNTEAIPELLVFPATGSANPVTRRVTGLPAGGFLTFTRFLLLGSVSPDDLVIDYGDAGGSNDGNGQLLFRVGPAGQATQYGHATVDSQLSSPSGIDGAVVDFTASQPGSASQPSSEIAFSEYSNSGSCGGFQKAKLLDTATGTVTTPGTPTGGGPGGYWVEGMWFDRTGTPYASLVPNLSTCTGPSPLGHLWPNGAVPVVCKLSGGGWVKAGSGVFQAAYGPGNWLAEQSGGMTQSSFSFSGAHTLTITGGLTPVTVPKVGAFAWAPSQP